MYLVVELLSRALSFPPDSSTETRLERLKETVAALDLPVAEAFPLLASLLALPGEGQATAAWTPQRLKQKTFETVLVMIRAMAARQPVLLALEDLHWADASSLELLTMLLEQVATAAICAVFTARPEFRPPWAARSHTSQLTLNRLSRRHTEAIAIGVARGKAMPPEVLGEIVERADGTPLFVEELTKMVLESGLLRLHNDRYEATGPLPPLAIPMTLHDSLMARLDRLATVKLVAQLGAVLGREFPYALLEAVAPESAALQHELTQLVDAELLYQRGIPPHATYVFKHALIQEAAYQSLLKSKRQQYPRRAAQAREERVPEIVTRHPEVVAQHNTQAGLAAHAIPYWRHAGEAAVRRSANAEAIAHFTAGLELVRTLPASHERTRQELGLLITLGPVLLATRGFAGPETVRTY
jgi:predicted ATPase